MFWTTAAYAMGGTPAGGGEPNALASFVPLILMFAVFYFLLIRPQQKKAKEHKAMMAQLKRGDDVITAGGLYGRITDTADDHVTLDLGETKVKVSRSAISAVPSMQRAAEKKPKKEEKKKEEKKEEKEEKKDGQ